jgi:outer membrane lipoprotein-sorting protein
MLRILLYLLAFLMPFLSQAEANLVEQINHCLNSLSTLEADFVQNTNGREIKHGTILLAKPHHFKIQYHDKEELMILGRKGSIVLYNKRLQEVSYIPSKKNITTIIAKEHIDIAKEVNISQLYESDKEVKLYFTLADLEGMKFAFVFKRQLNKLFLHKIITIDQLANTITMQLENARYNIFIAKKAFEFYNPKFFKKE